MKTGIEKFVERLEGCVSGIASFIIVMIGVVITFPLAIIAYILTIIALLIKAPVEFIMLKLFDVNLQDVFKN